MHLPTGLARAAVPLLAGALLGAATVVPTAISASAAAAVPVPAARSFGAVADAFPRYERENTCSPTQKPGAKALRILLRKTYGKSILSSTTRACSGSDSGHEEGRAVDWMTHKSVATEKAIANTFLAWMQATDSHGNTIAMARRLGIQYVIWNNRMWRAYDPGRGWTEYSDCLHKSKKGKKAFDNACHRTHVHFSLSWDGAYKRTSYFSGYVVCPTFYPQSPPPPAAPRGQLVTLSAQARILTTKSGNGMPNGPCRVRGDSPVDLRVLGRGGVPSDGVAAVVLRVAMVDATVLTRLRVWPAGGVMPTAAVASANPGTATADVTVAVGTNGMVTLRHGVGMSHFTANVLGYYLAADG